jgi:FXSXX-COOH protein
MDSISGSQVGKEDHQTELVDVTAVPLHDLTSSRNTVFDNAIRRLVKELDQPREPVAAFANYVCEPTE